MLLTADTIMRELEVILLYKMDPAQWSGQEIGT